MRQLIRKEIQSFFSSIIGYMVIAVFLLLCGLFLFVFPSSYNVLDYGYASFEAFFDLAPLVLLFLVPALCMRSFSEERRSGTLEILLTKPLSKIQIVAAKFTAAIFLLICALIPTMVFVLSIQELGLSPGSLDMGAIAGSYLGLIFLAGVFTAIGIFMSALSHNQIVAFVLGVLACGFMYIGFDLISSFFGQGELFLRKIGLEYHYNSMGRGVLDTRDLIYMISWIAIFGTATYLVLAYPHRKQSPILKHGLLVLSICMALNAISIPYFTRFDLTSDLRYTLKDSSKTLAQSIDDNVYFKIYLDGDLPSGFKRLQKETIELLDEFKAYNNLIQYELVNIYSIKDEQHQQALAQELMAMGVQPTNLVVKESGGSSRKMIFPAAVVSYRGKKTIVELIQSQVGASSEELLNRSIQSLEYQISSAIHRLRSEQRPSVAFLDGHGELGLRQSVEAAYALAPTYEVSRLHFTGRPGDLLDIDSLTGTLRPRVDAIIVAKPQKPFSDTEKWLLDQYVLHGGRVLWALEGSNASMDTLQRYAKQMVLPNQDNLLELIFAYGARVNPQLVMDLNCSYIPLVVGFAGDQAQTDMFQFPFFPVIESQHKHIIVKNLNPIRSEFISTIDTMSNAIRKTILLSSSPYTRSIHLPSEISFEFLSQELDPQFFNSGPKPVAVLLEGVFNSPYAYRSHPFPELNTLSWKRQSDSNGRMIVLADADLLSNAYHIKQDYPMPLGMDPYTREIFDNKAFLINCMNYLCDGETLLELRAREVRLRLLDKQRIDSERQRWQMINVGLPVLILILFGLIYHYLRRRRYTK